MKSAVGFIGLGSMGEPMLKCLHAAGFKVNVFDVNKLKVQSTADSLGSGVNVCTSAKDLAANSAFIITMLPSSDVVQSVLQGDAGMLAGMRSGTIWLDMTSGVPHKTQQFAQMVSQVGASMIDAPVSGGVSRARVGDLSIMVGGDQDCVDQCMPLLQAMGSSVVHTGGVGSAHAMKALNNLVSAGGFLIGVEALLIGQRFGLSADLMVDVLNSSTGCNNSTQKKFKQFVLSRTFDSGFSLDLMVKDLSIALDIATNSHTPVPFARLCRELWASAKGMLGEGQDHTAVAKFSEALSQDELRVNNAAK